MRDKNFRNASRTLHCALNSIELEIGVVGADDGLEKQLEHIFESLALNNSPAGRAILNGIAKHILQENAKWQTDEGDLLHILQSIERDE